MTRFTSQETEFKNWSLVTAVKVAIVLFVIAEIIVFVSLRGGDDSPAGRASGESAGADRPRQSFDVTEVLGGRVSIGTVDLDERVSLGRRSATGGEDGGAPGRIASSSSVSGASSDTGEGGGSSGTATSSDTSGGSSTSSGSTGGSSGSDSSPPSDDGGSTTTSNDGSSDGSGSTGGGGAGGSGGSTDGGDDSDGGYTGGGGGGGGCC